LEYPKYEQVIIFIYSIIKTKNYYIIIIFNRLAQDLFLKLTHFDPEERYTASQALEHPWITGENE